MNKNYLPNILTDQNRLFYQQVEQKRLSTALKDRWCETFRSLKKKILLKFKHNQNFQPTTKTYNYIRLTNNQTELTKHFNKVFFNQLNQTIAKVEQRDKTLRITTWQHRQRARIFTVLNNALHFVQNKTAEEAFFFMLNILKCYTITQGLESPQPYATLKTTNSILLVLNEGLRSTLNPIKYQNVTKPNLVKPSGWVQEWQSQQTWWYQKLKNNYIYVKLKQNYKHLAMIHLRRTLNNYFVTVTNGCGEVLIKKSLGSTPEFKDTPKKRDNAYIRTRLLGLALRAFPYPPNWAKIKQNQKIKRLKQKEKQQDKKRGKLKAQLKFAINKLNKKIKSHILDGTIQSLQVQHQIIENRKQIKKKLEKTPSLDTANLNAKKLWLIRWRCLSASKKRRNQKQLLKSTDCFIKPENYKQLSSKKQLKDTSPWFWKLKPWTQPNLKKRSSFMRWKRPANFQSHRAQQRHIWLQKRKKRHHNTVPTKHQNKRIIHYPIFGRSTPHVSLIVKLNFDFKVIEKSLDLYFKKRPMSLYGVEYSKNLAYNGCRQPKISRKKRRTKARAFR